MDKQPFYNNLKSSSSSAFAKGLKRFSKFVKTAMLHLKIHALKSRIKDEKNRIGDYVFNHQNEFTDNEYIAGLLAKIDTYNIMISAQKDTLNLISKTSNSKKYKKID